MSIPKAHASEIQRLDALHSFDILDTPRERDFDDVAQLASQICQTPIAVVNLIGDGRQFFKAEVGLGVRETPLESSFCAKAILEEDFLIVPDATRDPRFDCNPLVLGEPKLRFYAGALLKTDEGHAIGTVCVLDFQPRNLTLLQENTLRVLARQVMNQLNLRRLLQQKAAADARQQVLNHELSHRLKNSLAMAQAIASQTLKSSADKRAFQSFELRMEALGKAHELLLQQTNLTTASVAQVCSSILSLHDQAGRVLIAGPQQDLGPRTVLSLSLVLHELATNALKYGSLANDRGQVHVTWTIGDEVALTWKETGGPPVVLPTQKGFGSRLIRLGLNGNRNTSVDYEADGLRVVMRAARSDLSE